MNEESKCAKAVLDVTTEIRSSKRRPDSEKIVSTVARKLGLGAIEVKRNLDFLIESGAIINKPTAKGKESIYIFDMDSFVAGSGDFLDDEDPNDSSPELDASITNPPLLTGGSLNEGNLCANGETEFMAFLRLIEKLTNDIRRLDQKILEERDKNELLLEQNCKSKLENSTLENKIKRKSLVGTKEQREDRMHATSLCSEADFTLTRKGEKMSEMTSNPLERIKQAIEKSQVQWNTCLEERRKKYDQHKVASNLSYTQQNSEGRISTQLINNDLQES